MTRGKEGEARKPIMRTKPDAFSMVEARIRRAAGVQPAHPPPGQVNPREVNLTPFLL